MEVCNGDKNPRYINCSSGRGIIRFRKGAMPICDMCCWCGWKRGLCWNMAAMCGHGGKVTACGEVMAGVAVEDAFINDADEDDDVITGAFWGIDESPPPLSCWSGRRSLVALVSSPLDDDDRFTVSAMDQILQGFFGAGCGDDESPRVASSLRFSPTLIWWWW